MRNGELELPDWAPLVLAHTPGQNQGAFAALLALDFRLQRLVDTVSEPMLGQVRIAWWREEIAKPRAVEAPQPPDPLLTSIIGTWGDQRKDLVELANGWENLLAEAPIDAEASKEFCRGRAMAFSAYAMLAGEDDASEACAKHGFAWGAAEIVLRNKGTGPEIATLPSLPRSLRSVAMIGGLSARALKRGGGHLLGDRLSPLVALRLGIFGT